MNPPFLGENYKLIALKLIQPSDKENQEAPKETFLRLLYLIV